MTGIYDCFGYGPGYDVSFEERYSLIKEAGFDCVMLWWSDKFGRGEGYQKDADLARDAGLKIENMHAPVHEQNDLSADNMQGKHVLHDYLQCVEDCFEHDISTVVIHLPDDSCPLDKIGNDRIDRIVDRAGELGINVAFENLRNIQNLTSVLDRIEVPHIGYCYDSCHHMNYAPDTDLLKMYGQRLKAIHLQDNGGTHNQHQLPFDGNIDWSHIMGKLKETGYDGAITLEPMNWDYTHLGIRDFLNLAYERAKRLEQILS